MSPIPLGILAAQGGFSYNPVLAYDLLTTVNSDFSTNVVTLNNLSIYASTYKHLELRVTARSTAQTTSFANVQIEVNGGGSYHIQNYSLTAGGVGAYTTAGRINFGFAPQSTFPMTEQDRGNMIVRLPDAFSSTKFKTVWFQNNSQGSDSRHNYGVGMKTNDTLPISSITLRIDAGQFRQSRFSLYGVRG